MAYLAVNEKPPEPDTTPDTAPDDETLIRAVAGGDQAAFRALAARYMKPLHALTYRMAPRKSEAEDLTQEILLRVWQKAGQWRPDGGASVKTWLYRVASHYCIDIIRKQGREQTHKAGLEPGVLTPERPSGLQQVQEEQTAAIVREAIETLPARQRAALVLCHYEGLSNQEAAGTLGVGLKAVESLLVRARRHLRDKLSRYEGVI